MNAVFTTRFMIGLLFIIGCNAKDDSNIKLGINNEINRSDEFSSNLKHIIINEATFNYTDTGSGEPIVFVHGGLEDYRTWEPQIEIFSKDYRIITYSRRYNFPNDNQLEVNSFSAKTEAEDLARFITDLKLGPVHVVGHSFGGLISLFLTKSNPELVRSLTLSEPALISWLIDIPGGKVHYDDFYNKLIEPIKQAFHNKDTVGVLRKTLIYFAGADILEKLPEEAIDQMTANLPEWYFMSQSPDPFPEFKRKDLNDIKVPILTISGGQTLPMLQLINKELKTILPKAPHYHLEEGTHDLWFTFPEQAGQAVLSFIETIPKK
ncbi:alpha/beta fold hydrolase [Cecembia rubra]|uniref:Pimeloyl-ACP methyl ester carboxylesterase n=1 Tax=Cecembia rubra TaxID=1485585 RepID=A0A2P8DYG9_9BACT|nr:alpha/beta hydrolase [Cecembia rubra]PSL02268.1 pimeloyl-ACP methyl ester carboxylesterase [Cecembia rubra]